MRQIFIILSLLFLAGCFILGPKKPSSKLLYRGKFSESVILKISFSNNPDNNLYRILLYEKNKLIGHYEITDIPKRFVIDKIPTLQKGQNSILRMVSDTVNAQLRCIDFSFPISHCNQTTLLTFTSITDEERRIFQLFSKVINETRMALDFKNTENEKLLGWVKINY